MAEETKIEWATHTFNPWIGCSKVAAGCTNCYAEAYAKRYNKAQWGPHGTRVKTSDSNWKKPDKWEREAARSHLEWQRSAVGEWHHPRVFCASLADVFEDWEGWVLNSRGEVVGQCKHDCGCRELGTTPACPPHCSKCGGPMETATLDDLRRDLFALIDATPYLDWLLLTKRPENIRRMWPVFDNGEVNTAYRHNVWLLTSIATQEDADRNVPELLKCHDLAPVLGLSCEPLLGPVDLTHLVEGPDGDHGWTYRHYNALNGDRWCDVENYIETDKIDWVIIGCESNGRRVGRLNGSLSSKEPHSEEIWRNWAGNLVAQCHLASVAAFVKQIPVKGRVSHDPSEWPEELRVREFPEAGRVVGH